MKRIFIICNSNFPRGGAIANYIQYLMLCIQECGFETVLVSDLNEEYIHGKNHQSQRVRYRNFDIEPVIISKNRIIRHMQYQFGFARSRIAALKKNRISSEDMVIVLGQNVVFYKWLLLWRKIVGFKVIGGLLEMYDRHNYSGDDRAYEKYRYVLEKIFPQFDALMPISTYIEKHYRERGMKTICLPIMADSQEFEVKQKKYDKWYFIIPANGKMKDSLSSMLWAFSELENEELRKLELHLCGVKEEVVREVLGKTQFEKLKSSLIIHKWMKYEQLISLYQKMHFLVLARGISQMTMANFPSKVPETMCFGIVPIVSEVGDYTKYYLQDGVNSIFIHGCEKEECKVAIRKALQLTKEEYNTISKEALSCAKNRFDYRKWVSTVQEMLENV